MSIDISGLFLFDVEISVQGNGITVITQVQECIEDLLALPSPVFTYHCPESGVVLVSAHGTDTIALAERIAISFEDRSYKVKRTVTPLFSIDGREVQSFVLA
jgi:hypothetical protein